MRKYLFYAFASLALALGACGGGNPRIEVSCDDFYAQARQVGSIELAPGEQFELVLCSNPTTGFQWEDPAVISDPAALEQTGMIYEEPAGRAEAELAGAPGAQSWSFKALEGGRTQVTFTYSQPWDGGEKSAWSYMLDITVR